MTTRVIVGMRIGSCRGVEDSHRLIKDEERSEPDKNRTSNLKPNSAEMHTVSNTPNHDIPPLFNLDTPLSS